VPEPHAFAVRSNPSSPQGSTGLWRRRLALTISLTGSTALQFRFAPPLLRPPHPQPTFVTMANAPLLGPGWGELLPVICPTAKAEYFPQEGLTAFFDLPVGRRMG